MRARLFSPFRRGSAFHASTQGIHKIDDVGGLFRLDMLDLFPRSLLLQKVFDRQLTGMNTSLAAQNPPN
jgi:hypothetical protein